MKKLLTVLLSFLMVLACGTTVFADDPTTEVNYTVEESYEFTVPATTTIAATATTLTNGVAITKNSIAYDKALKITVASTNSWNLVLEESAEDKLAYQVSLSSSSWTALTNGALVLESNSGVLGTTSLFGKLTGTVGNQTKSGKYLDTLTFTATVDTPTA